MFRFSLLLSALLLAPLAASSQPMFDQPVFFSEGSYDFSPGTDVPAVSFGTGGYFETDGNFTIGAAVVHSAQRAYGFKFSATTVSMHPQLSYKAPGGGDIAVGAYASGSYVTTPAFSNAFFGAGVEGLYSDDDTHIGAAIGVNGGPAIANPLANIDAGAFIEQDITPANSVFVAYRYSNLTYWPNQASMLSIGTRLALSSVIAGMDSGSMTLSLARINNNGTPFTEARIGIDIPIGAAARHPAAKTRRLPGFLYSTDPEGDDHIMYTQGLSLSHTFTF